MDDQIILAVDDNGKFRGEYIPKWEGHTGSGKRHLAITVLIYNSKGEVLLQKRKHKVFDDIWDLTGATHPLHTKDGDETVEEATWRCLEREYGIKEKVKLKNLGFFNYFAKYGSLCENEHCAMVIGEYNGNLNLNEEVGYGYKWMDKNKFLKEVKKNSCEFTEWTKQGLKVLENSGFFN
ncbi:MAG: hypothetical protein ACD_30C00090G0016 [uncultured bacterium]|uniref:Nudix hydrolase domain-containing protein n=3 Tax=Candidatus Daviesiibacteriota TaxID=1752718 RepID=A0A0G0HWU0_9BACT|nr:MAG: hypothetical protein ACD_30C00090G0016 [uncultured bacterium]KKQ08361.1 MAG: hypothetical protein US19_C0026G0002 [Candidatus Daviesbacteria bacterium GW2011_GWB1_36_5]KKQ16173.1 MAG: hypothetical protein US28_C0004G0015 [Candidatus Daviesbacteria bacterium GW2011_GWA1_36_8]OGE33249.1 MAG: hypothetical protein A3C99_01380 [Candidatus Daviesbacteria bacterium RIFCSPHIGHO2_02_FULL_37_9]OGE36151.1 MAG: hypothetical protein A3E66_05070 [Candidatus Daviesbacteria bacterium RIFCSPHIGHO2_12_FU